MMKLDSLAIFRDKYENFSSRVEFEALHLDRERRAGTNSFVHRHPQTGKIINNNGK